MKNMRLHYFKQHLLSRALLALFLGTRHEDHVVDFANRPDHVSNLLFGSIIWDACQIHQAICVRRVLGYGSLYFLFLLGWCGLCRLGHKSERLR